MAIRIRPMNEQDLEEARRVLNLAFGTFVGAPEPERFFGDMDYLGTRFNAPNTAVFVAEENGELLGSNVATRWGSVAFFGPLSVRPDRWDAGLGRRLLAPVLETFDAWNPSLRGLYTFAQSPKHVGLYHRHGFHPRFLTAIMFKPVENVTPGAAWTTWSALSDAERERAAAGVRALTDSIYPGLDITGEIESVAAQDLGDTILLGSADDVQGVAVCHTGANTEAGGGRCFIKFACAASGDGAAERFAALLEACEAFAADRGAQALSAGVNTAREEAYRAMLEHGFRTQIQGVIMHAPNEPGYSTPGRFVIDDWR